MAHLTEASDLVGPFYVADDAVEVADDARAQLTDDAGAVLDAAVTALEAVPDEHSGVLGSERTFTAAVIEAALREALVEGLGLKPRFAFGPLRTAVSGRRVSPPLFESMEILGQSATLTRLQVLRATL
jgi:glutamyl-tRNA synthetase